MLVSDVLHRLAVGQLSNLALSDATQTPTTIREAEIPKILGYMNDALMLIYTRFSLCEKEVIIKQMLSVNTYQLSSRFSQINNKRQSSDPAYIWDSTLHPFKDDAINIISVRNQYGRIYPLNQEDILGSLFTPFPTTLQIIMPEDGEFLSVVYQARHYELINLYDQLLPLNNLFPAFLSLISYFVYRDMNSVEMSSKAQEHYVFYDAECNKIEAKGHNTITTNNDLSAKFCARGFV